MGKSKGINKMWTLDEETFLIENYFNMKWELLLERLHRHTKKQIIDKASYIGLKRERLWSFDDIEKLKEKYMEINSYICKNLFYFQIDQTSTFSTDDKKLTFIPQNFNVKENKSFTPS